MKASEPGYLKTLNEKQREAVLHSGSSLLILAGAGSGKTRVITTKIAHLIDQLDVSPSSILAVTFTNRRCGDAGTCIRNGSRWGPSNGPDVPQFRRMGPQEICVDLQYARSFCYL